MARFRISVTNADRSAGVGPVIVVADTSEEAIQDFLADEMMTVESMAADGLDVWTVTQL